MSVAEALRIIKSGDEGGGGDGPDAGNGTQALDPRMLGRDVLDRLIAARELAVEVLHDGEQRGDEREQRPGRGSTRTRWRPARRRP